MPSASEFLKDVASQAKKQSAKAFLADITPPASTKFSFRQLVENLPMNPSTFALKQAVALPEFVKNNAYPLAGAAAFGLATGGLGVIPAAAAVGVGAGLGQAVKQGKEAVQGRIQPSSLQAAKEIGGQVALGATGELGGRALGAAMKATGPELQRIGPAWLRVFGGLKQESGEALVRNPAKIAAIAQKNPLRIMNDTAQTLKSGIKKFVGLLKDSNEKLTSVIEEASKKANPIQADTAVFHALETAQERGITQGSLNPKDNILVNRILSTVSNLSKKTGKLDLKTAATLRTDIGNQIGALSESPNVQAVYVEFKKALDTAIQAALPKELGEKFILTLKKQSELRAMRQEILPILSSPNSAVRISNQLDNPMAVLPSGKTMAQGLQDFDTMIGGNFIEPIRNNVRALPFAEDIVQNLPAGSTGAIGLKSGMAASMIPYAGKLVSPRNLVKTASFLERLPKTQLPYTRAGIQAGGKLSLFNNQDAQ